MLVVLHCIGKALEISAKFKSLFNQLMESQIMNTLIAFSLLAYVLLVCAVGACAAICGFKRIDDFCARQLED